MKIDGKALATDILESLQKTTTKLKEQGIVPILSVILIGDNPSSLSYIRQKQLAAGRIGVTVNLLHLPENTSPEELISLLNEQNTNPAIHGIIVQRPLPSNSSITKDILEKVTPKKDVDGFVPHSLYEVPVAKAIWTLLKHIHGLDAKYSQTDFMSWLKQQHITIVGRGETAGAPIAHLFAAQGLVPTIVHSQTQHREAVLRESTIIVSCVGKPDIIRADMISPGTILMSVGLSATGEGKLVGDYNDQAIEKVSAYYTPTPGGVGPLNVASLMQNVVQAASQSREK